MRKKIPDLTMALAGRFAAHHGLLAGLHLDHIDHLNVMIGRLEMSIDGAVAPFARERDLLMTIPGIGERAAQTIVAEIGVDMSRFPTADHLASWAGLCPGNNELAGKRKKTATRNGNAQLCSVLVRSCDERNE
jgi:transposase